MELRFRHWAVALITAGGLHVAGALLLIHLQPGAPAPSVSALRIALAGGTEAGPSAPSAPSAPLAPSVDEPGERLEPALASELSEVREVVEVAAVTPPDVRLRTARQPVAETAIEAESVAAIEPETVAAEMPPEALPEPKVPAARVAHVPLPRPRPVAPAPIQERPPEVEAEPEFPVLRTEVPPPAVPPPEPPVVELAPQPENPPQVADVVPPAVWPAHPLAVSPVEPVQVVRSARPSLSAAKPVGPPDVALAPRPPPAASVASVAASGQQSVNGVGTPGAAVSGVTPDYTRRLLAWLERHKRYPPAAQRRGLEGHALLKFRIARDGRVLWYEVARSSGYSVLDREVADMIRRADPVPLVPSSYSDSKLQFAVPVVFKLR